MTVQGMEWVWEMLKLALAPGMTAGVDLPRVVYLEDLEHVKLKRWMCFGAALSITDRYANQIASKHQQRCFGARDSNDRCSDHTWVTRMSRRLGTRIRRAGPASPRRSSRGASALRRLQSTVSTAHLSPGQCRARSRSCPTSMGRRCEKNFRPNPSC